VKVELRDVIADDLAILYEFQLDPVAVEMAAFPPRDRDPFIAHWTKIMGDEAVVTKTVLVDGQVAGDIVSFDRLGKREVGYWIGRDHWGKGVASQALSAFLQLDLARPLFARVATQNLGSIRVLEKCGFTVIDMGDEEPDPLGDGVEETLLRLDRPT
jgi:RimJ/RimL family protein N-acetyltransferase